ncbi:MAG: hypothetical protein LBH89_02955 [Lactococcus lactis]|jgi:hypothetical protein|nr:hypothetical protein [Lactococcus lactis]
MTIEQYLKEKRIAIPQLARIADCHNSQLYHYLAGNNLSKTNKEKLRALGIDEFREMKKSKVFKLKKTDPEIVRDSARVIGQLPKGSVYLFRQDHVDLIIEYLKSREIWHQIIYDEWIFEVKYDKGRR